MNKENGAGIMTMLGSPAGCDACPTRDELQAELDEALEYIDELERDLDAERRDPFLGYYIEGEWL